MAGNNENDLIKCNIRTDTKQKKMAEIRSTVKNVSKLPSGTKVIGPDFYLAYGFTCCVSFKVQGSIIYVYICNKATTKVDITRRLILYDSNNVKLHEENDAKIFSLETNQDVDLGGGNESSYLKTLTNDMLIIDLCVIIEENVKKTIKQSICEINSEKNLREDLKTLLENPITSDVTLQVGEERIPAHWAVLCSRSPYFKKMFESEMKERVQNSITITDISINTLKTVIEFLYTANFPHTGEGSKLEKLFELYYAADKYEVMDLRTLCVYEIMNNASTANVGKILQCAYRHRDKEFKMQATSFLKRHSEAVLQTEGWKEFEANEPAVAEALSFVLNEADW